jgi:sulfiredoxin
MIYISNEEVARLMVKVREIPLNQIKRPLPRENDPNKVAALMASIREIGQQEPIDVLEVDGQYYGFSGCHRYEACQRLGKETVLARVRKAPRAVLKMHLA